MSPVSERDLGLLGVVVVVPVPAGTRGVAGLITGGRKKQVKPRRPKKGVANRNVLSNPTYPGRNLQESK